MDERYKPRRHETSSQGVLASAGDECGCDAHAAARARNDVLARRPDPIGSGRG
jgi:hypothetical protein